MIKLVDGRTDEFQRTLPTERSWNSAESRLQRLLQCQSKLLNCMRVHMKMKVSMRNPAPVQLSARDRIMVDWWH